MELTFAQQTTAFFWSFVPGVGLAVFYGVLKFLRFTFSPGKAAVIAADIFFMLVWALTVFFFSLAFLLGYVRLYVFVGTFMGFLLYRLTIGRLLFMLYSPVISFLKNFHQKISKKIKIFAKYLLKIACRLLYNISRVKDSIKNKHKKQLLSEKAKKRKKHDFKKTKEKKDGNRPLG